MSGFWVGLLSYLLVAMLSARRLLRAVCYPFPLKKAHWREVAGSVVLALVWPAWPFIEIVGGWLDWRKERRGR